MKHDRRSSDKTARNIVLETVNEVLPALKIVVAQTVEESLPKAFLLIGIDVGKPLEIQKDMAFVRGARKTGATIVAAISTAFTGWIVYLWHGGKS